MHHPAFGEGSQFLLGRAGLEFAQLSHNQEAGGLRAKVLASQCGANSIRLAAGGNLFLASDAPGHFLWRHFSL